jgi:YesN/AraC family two-component response regulator
MIGQFIKNADKESIEDHIRRTWQDCQFSQEALYRLPTLSHDAVDSIAMIMSVCAEYLCFQNIITVKHDKRIEEVNRYIDTHLHEPISVQQLAKVFGISRTSLYMLIKNNYGKGITEHINDVKIQHAKELLQQGYSVKAILEIINISDTNYFYRMFRKCTGMTVREFKAQLKKENNEND